MEKENRISRRDFLEKLVKLPAIGLTGCVAGGLARSLDSTFGLPPREDFSQRERVSTQESIKIDGMETFGDGTALDADQVRALVLEFNSEPLRPRDPRTHYSTEYVMESDYRNWQSRGTGIGNQPESYQKFLNRHNQVIDNMLNTASPYLSGGLECRRLIVVKDEVMYGKNLFSHLLDSPYRPLDSDGSIGGYITWPYNAEQSGWWDPALCLDMGFIHETGHAILKLPDEYPLGFYPMAQGVNLSENALAIHSRLHLRSSLLLPDTVKRQIENQSPRQILDPQTVIDENPGLVGIPPDWWEYSPSNRNDERGQSIMANMKLKIGLYAGWVLTRRVVQGWSHEYPRRLSECSAVHYPADGFSPHDVIKLPNKYKGFVVEVWRTSGTYYNKYLNDLISTFNSDVTISGEIDLGNPFYEEVVDDRGNGFIPVGVTNLMLKIKNLQEEVVAWRLMDAGDFCPMYTATTGPPEVLRMEMEFAEGNVSQLDHNWKINYLRNLYLPGIQG